MDRFATVAMPNFAKIAKGNSRRRRGESFAMQRHAPSATSLVLLNADRRMRFPISDRQSERLRHDPYLGYRS